MQRTRSQKLENLADLHFRRKFLNWNFNKYLNDQGIDYSVEIIDNLGNLTGSHFFVQLKATENIQISENHVTYNFDAKNLLYYEKVHVPILIIIYDVKNDNSYWINSQSYIKNTLDKEKPKWRTQKTIRISIPIENRISNNLQQKRSHYIKKKIILVKIQ